MFKFLKRLYYAYKTIQNNRSFVISFNTDRDIVKCLADEPYNIEAISLSRQISTTLVQKVCADYAMDLNRQKIAVKIRKEYAATFNKLQENANLAAVKEIVNQK